MRHNRSSTAVMIDFWRQRSYGAGAGAIFIPSSIPFTDLDIGTLRTKKNWAVKALPIVTKRYGKTKGRELQHPKQFYSSS